MKTIKIFTDGGCDPNPGPGGWGFVIKDGEIETEGSGGDTDTTNNKMELTAVIEAFKCVKQPTVAKIYSDSKYVVSGINSWLERWIATDFKPHERTKGERIKNEDLWREIWNIKLKNSITAYWVKGHNGIRLNERADKLALKGRLEAIGAIEEDEMDEQIVEIHKVLIDPHYCSREEFGELIQYLRKNSWDFILLPRSS